MKRKQFHQVGRKSMDRYELTRGEGRVKVSLSAHDIGGDLVVYIFNENAHIGAVATGERGLPHQ